MTDPFLLLTPVLVGGVLALVRFVGCDRVLGFEPVSPAPNTIVDFSVDPASPPPTRNDYTGWVGMVIQPTADQSLIGLGRWCSPMDSGAHQVKLVDAATGQDVPGAIVTVPLVNQPPNAFVFAKLPTPVKLTGGSSYYLMSYEQTGQDGFIDFNITVTPSADFTVPSAVFGDPAATPPSAYMLHGATNNCYGPVNGQY